jgi:hypothetical protein
VVTPNEAIAWINSKQRKFNNRVAAFSLCRVSRDRLPRPAHALPLEGFVAVYVSAECPAVLSKAGIRDGS